MNYDVLHLDPLPIGPGGRLPNGEERRFQPLAVTLISGTADAVLVDPPTTRSDAQAVGDWIAAGGKNLTHIAITHGHGDHWFTADLLARRFGAQVVATAPTIELMRFHEAARPLLWDTLFPGQIPASPVTATTVPGDRFRLEGDDIVLVPVGASDCADSSVVHVPALGLVVAGDVLYNGAHMYLGDAAAAGVQEWRAAIAKIADLDPRWVVAGHGDRALDHDARRIIAGSLDYLGQAEAVLAGDPSATGYFDAMLARYPDYRHGTTLAWVSAKAIRALRDGEEFPAAAVAAWLS
ncbi:MBL fold metallo-hydrolase [Actinoplanes sp. NPDC051411]|uniref:MBL fold metallo-hydrolase n=1 Tax=Actinoplanes sp. NPDC051411 TaxID=3155522 RepID=UPI003434C15F